MYMNKFITSVVFLFFGVIAGAQSQNFYYYKNNKVPIELDRTGLTLIVEESFSVSDLRAYNFKPFEFQIDSTNNNTDKYAVIDLSNTVNQSEYRQLLKTLNAIPNVIKANPNFKNSVDEDIGLSNYFYVKLKSPSDFHVLQSEASRNNVIIFEQNKFMPLWYTLKVTKNTIGSTLEVANRFYETGLFASSQPDFLADDIACSDDPMFGSLWGLHNSSNPDYDINICEAWNITEGENINVAVLDTGIEKTHGDLNANMSPLSFNTETGTSPSQVFGDHGTHCAGIIAAEKDNNTQVVGVAPKAKLMDVSNSLLSTANSRMKRADGINWAWQNGADVISNSWGSTIMYDVIDDAIDNALQNGRDGKGTLIVFASGNDYNNVVSYPANSNPDILAVGSITSSGNRSDFSNYGNQLDVVAPGSNILSTVLNNE